MRIGIGGYRLGTLQCQAHHSITFAFDSAEITPESDAVPAALFKGLQSGTPAKS